MAIDNSKQRMSEMAQRLREFSSEILPKERFFQEFDLQAISLLKKDEGNWSKFEAMFRMLGKSLVKMQLKEDLPALDQKLTRFRRTYLELKAQCEHNSALVKIKTKLIEDLQV